MHRSFVPYFFFGLAAVIAAAAVFVFWKRGVVVTPAVPVPVVENPVTPAVEPPAAEKSPEIREDPTAALADPGPGAAAADPAALVAQVAKSLENGDLAKTARLLGKNALDPETARQLRELADSPLKLRPAGGFREVGELEINASTRWALELEGRPAGSDRIYLDLRRIGGKWSVEKISLPPAATAADIAKPLAGDSLGAADAFIQAVLRQDFESARAIGDAESLSDAKIAGLCILFEEGEYRLRKSKPLRSLFLRPDTAGYLANIESRDGKQTGQFGITLRQPAAGKDWLVSEINLDQLLADYAGRFGNGDLYYTPLVKNPAGGDTLALYFDFDEDEMHPRTRRQLEIVTRILKADPAKKITLSGHTDSLGTEDYNDLLSSRRAAVVRDFLEKSGVPQAQIVTVGKGSSQPRRPNVTETGLDNPQGRRANRRTEIYLDF